MSEFRFRSESIVSFSCNGCTGFTDYCEKVGIKPDSDGYYDVDQFKTKNEVINTNFLIQRYFDEYNISYIQPVFDSLQDDDYLNACKGVVELPYMVNGENLKLVLPGTAPQFCSPLHWVPLDGLSDLASFGNWQYIKIERTSENLIIRYINGTETSDDGKKTFTKDDFEDGVIPLRLGFYLQASGGPGGTFDKNVFGGTSGGGGGSGATAFGVLDLASDLGKDAGGNPYAYYTDKSEYGQMAHICRKAANKIDYIDVCKVWGGGTGKTPKGGAGGTLATYDSTYIFSVYNSASSPGELKGYGGVSGGQGASAGTNYTISQEMIPIISHNVGSVVYNAPYTSACTYYGGVSSSDGADWGGGGAASFFGGGGNGSEEDGEDAPTASYGAGGAGAGWYTGNNAIGLSAPGCLILFY